MCGNTFFDLLNLILPLSYLMMIGEVYLTEQLTDKPMKKPKRKKLRELVEPTAASLISPSVCPTIKVSTTLYNSCKRFPIITGMAKNKIWLNILPCVRFRTDFEPVIIIHTSLLKFIVKNNYGLQYPWIRMNYSIAE